MVKSSDAAHEEHLRPREDELRIRVFYGDAEQVVAAQSSDGHPEEDPEQRYKGTLDDELPADHALLEAQSP
jgi:hypothetical protein